MRPSPVLAMSRAMDALAPEASVTTAAMRCPLALPTSVQRSPSEKVPMAQDGTNGTDETDGTGIAGFAMAADDADLTLDGFALFHTA